MNHALAQTDPWQKYDNKKKPMTLEERITKLTGLRYRLIGPIHHKDKDCHFSIRKHWSYGGPPVYEIDHYGYLDNSLDGFPTFNTSLDAHFALEKWLLENIRDWLDVAKNPENASEGWDKTEIELIENELNNIGREPMDAVRQKEA